MKKSPVLYVAAGLLLSGSLETALCTDIANDQFSDGDRTSQTPALGAPPYSSLRWYSNATDSVDTDTSGLAQHLSPTGRTLWGYFTTQGSPVTLAVGESIRMTFDYVYQVNTGGSGGMMRLGLYDGGSGTRPTTEGTVASPSTFALSTLKGYGFEINSQASGTNGGVMKREINSATDTGLFGGAGYVTVGSPFSTIDSGATPRTGQVTIVNNGSNVSATLNLDINTPGASTTIVDTSTSRVTTFDMTAFLNYSNSGSNTVHFDNIHLEHLTSGPTTSTIVDEQFADADRTSQTPALGAPPYSSLHWFGSHADTLDPSGFNLAQAITTTPRTLWTYFTAQNSPVTLGKDETIQLTFDYTYTVDSSGGGGTLRFGLFNGGSAARDLTDGTTAAPAPFNQNTVKGYAVETNSQASVSNGSVLKKENNNGVTGGIFTSGTGGSYGTVNTSSGSGTFQPLGVPAMVEIFDEQYYTELEGGILEGLGRLFKKGVKLYVYPYLHDGELVTAGNFRVAPNIKHLYAHLLENGFIEPLESYHHDYLSIKSSNVLARIRAGDAAWETMVSPEVAQIIKERRLFGFN